MNLISAGVTSAILAAGLAGSVAAYRGQAARAGEVVPVKFSEPAAVVKWAPCQAPSQLEDGVCVTDVVRTVVRPAPPAPPPTTSTYPDSSENEIPQQVEPGGDDEAGDDEAGYEAGDDLYGEERRVGDGERSDDDVESEGGYTDAEEREDD